MKHQWQVSISRSQPGMLVGAAQHVARDALIN
jgi:hypothetical protein